MDLDKQAQLLYKEADMDLDEIRRQLGGIKSEIVWLLIIISAALWWQLNTIQDNQKKISRQIETACSDMAKLSGNSFAIDYYCLSTVGK